MVREPFPAHLLPSAPCSIGTQQLDPID
jgi:hypothetical protein